MKSPVSFAVSRALEGIELLSASDRADLYTGVADILDCLQPASDSASAARKAAAAIRESEAMQLYFLKLFNSTP